MEVEGTLLGEIAERWINRSNGNADICLSRNPNPKSWDWPHRETWGLGEIAYAATEGMAS
ncbi:hypothetical protein FA13DRAFT_1737563 [Coprinellus micaceus]|uniref:Uncharacterized protein n=1 Tax=Coprinellus micaceus TaxID=71717 RepID=A0A4Y7SX20_COPMI|nr:hypothetical protein FA13DRAFT_1737563 [Coprinellus micaceus]